MGVTINHNDMYYGVFNEKMLVNDFNKAYRKFEDTFFGRTLSIKDIIKIPNFDPNKNQTTESNKIQTRLMTLLFETLLTEASTDESWLNKLISYIENLSFKTLEHDLENLKNDTTVTDADIKDPGGLITTKDMLIDTIKNEYNNKKIANLFNDIYTPATCEDIYKTIYLSMNNFSERIAILLSKSSLKRVRNILAYLLLQKNNIKNAQIKGKTITDITTLEKKLEEIANNTNDKTEYETLLTTEYGDSKEKLELIFKILHDGYLAKTKDNTEKNLNNIKSDFFVIIKSGLAFNENDNDEESNTSSTTTKG
jgi:hypothetical protein